MSKKYKGSYSGNNVDTRTVTNENYGGTRSGVRPDSSTYHYKLTTSQAQKYLQDKIDRQIEKWNNSTQKDGTPLPYVEKIDIILGTSNYGHRKPGKKGKIKGNHFTPFILILPIDVNPDFVPNIEEGEWEGFYIQDRNINERIGKKVNIIPPVASVINAYVYNDYDTSEGLLSYRNSKSREFFQKYNIKNNSREFKEIIALSRPRIAHVSETESRIVVMIDPLRLLADMVRRVGGKPIYVKNVESIQIRDSEYKYFIEAKERKSDKVKNPEDYYKTLSTKDINILTRNF